MRRNLFSILLMVAGGLFAAQFAHADSITPSTYEDTLALGESVTITKTVTVSDEGPTSAKVDVFFLADETGSMFGSIAAVAASASSILSTTAGLGDVQFGVGGYRDEGDAFVYRQLTDLTASQATAQTAINTWAASGGGDTPEANLSALEQVATGTSWRDGSTRILVWFGDAPGHDPRNGSTEVSATNALQGENIVVQAIDIGGLNDTGQATRITAATGGTYFSDIDSGSIVDAITAAISAVFDEYSTVSLQANGNLPGVGVTIEPLEYNGEFDRSIERTFTFDVTFTGLAVGTHNFTIDALIDGGIVATETDMITVFNEPVSAIPLPGALPLMLTGATMLGLFGARRRRKG